VSTGNIFLTERGFGTSYKGEAHVIAGPDGEPLNLRIVSMALPKPNGSIGGELVIVPLSERNLKSKSYINSKSVVYEISVKRTKDFSNIQIRKINAVTMEVEIFQTALMPGQDGDVRFIESNGMINSKEAKQLLTTTLTEAVNKAMERSYDPGSDKLYYGNFAQDTEPVKRELFVKTKDLVKV